MTISDFLSKLDGVKRDGESWAARCPAHEDRTPSLSVREGRDGRVLVHCHAGCDVQAITTALGMRPRDLFADSDRHTRDEIAATYDYTDERGNILYQVVRFLPKGFRQRRPDGAGGWTWSLNGVRRVLYRLPEILAGVAAGKRVWIAEGERDCESLRARGHVATTNPGGAGKWRREYGEALRGADVVIVADKDEPGRAHARAVAHALRDVAKRMVVIEAAEGKDATDHFAAGKLERDFRRVDPAAPPSAGESPAPSSADTLVSIGALLAEPDDPVSWIVDGLLPASGMSLFASKPKAGKSTTARGLALAVARGTPFLGRQTVQGPVLYLGLEDPRRVTKGHFVALGARPTDDLYVFTGRRPQDAVTWLATMLTEHDPVLVIVDTQQRVTGIADLNDYAKVTSALEPLLALVRPRRAHLMLLHHAGKGERTGFDAVLGSVGFQGVADVIWLLRRREDDTRTLATMQRMGTDLPESVLVLDDRRAPQIGPPKAEHDANEAGRRILAYLEGQDTPVERARVLEAVEGRGELIGRALVRLVEAGDVLRSGGGKRGDPFLFCRSRPTQGIAERNPKTPGSAHEIRPYSVPTMFEVSEGGGNGIEPDPDELARLAMRDDAA